MLLLWNRGELSETGREAGRGLRWGLLPAVQWLDGLSFCLFSMFTLWSIHQSFHLFIHSLTHLSVESILGASHVFFFFLTEDAKRYDIIPMFERLDSAGICTDV